MSQNNYVFSFVQIFVFCLICNVCHSRVIDLEHFVTEVLGDKFVFEYYVVEERGTVANSPLIVYDYESWKSRNFYFSGDDKTKFNIALGDEHVYSFLSVSGVETKLANGIYYYNHISDRLVNLNCTFSLNGLLNEENFHEVICRSCLDSLRELSKE